MIMFIKGFLEEEETKGYEDLPLALRMAKLTILGKATTRILMIKIMLMTMKMDVLVVGASSDNNAVYSPCSDTQISKGDGFTFGVAISSKEAFFLDQIQLSPCDSRLGLAAKMAQLALFRPKVDEISLLSIDTSKFNPVSL